MKQKITLVVFGLFCFTFFVPQATKAQNYYFETQYKFDTSSIAFNTKPPQISVFPNIELPENARKNGVEGTIKASLTLAEDSTAKNIIIDEGLPFGASEAVAKALAQIRFQPATQNGKPVAVKMFFDFIITATYDENDKSVNKPKIVEKPAAVYPESGRAEARKGKVLVGVAFYADGTTKKILQVSSTMPKEFDRAAKDAAEKIKFQPATHKKSKKPVAQAMTIEYDFKP